MTPAPRGLHGVLVHELGRKIVDGTYPVGAVLTPDEIGSEYDASRPTVREALRVLESKGMLRIRQSLGTRVQPIEEWNLLDAEVVAWRLQGSDRAVQVRELIEMRLAVEPISASLTAMTQDADALQTLESACTSMASAVADADVHAFTEADVAFHAALLRGSGNQMFDRLTELIATALEAREESLSQHHVDLSPAALEQHRVVLRAILDGDRAAAERTMGDMLRGLLVEPVSTGQVGGSVEPQPANTAVG